MYHQINDQSWKDRNKFFASLANHVDVVFPSLYTFYNDQAGWEQYATANIAEARKYNKPVYAFIWPQYHGSNATIGGQHIAGDYWRKQLETVYQYADGVVIWAGWGWQNDWDVVADETDPGKLVVSDA